MNPIKAARLAAGYTQRGLANLSSLSADYIKCLETGQRDISKCKPETIARLTRVPGMERCMYKKQEERVRELHGLGPGDKGYMNDTTPAAYARKFRIIIKEGQAVSGTEECFAFSPGKALGGFIDGRYLGKEPPRGVSFFVQEVKR